MPANPRDPGRRCSSSDDMASGPPRQQDFVADSPPGRPARQAILTAMSLSDAWEQARLAWRRLAASGKRAGADDDGLATLSDIGVVRRILDQSELAAVRTARLRGKSWAEIATHLGVTRQSAWERWRDLDDSPGGEPPLSPVSTALDAAAGQLLDARERRRASKVLVPNVVGLDWIQAREVLAGSELVAINAQPDAPTAPGSRDWVITDQT